MNFSTEKAKIPKADFQKMRISEKVLCSITFIKDFHEENNPFDLSSIVLFRESLLNNYDEQK